MNKYDPVKRGLFDTKPQIDEDILSRVLGKDETFRVVDEFKDLEAELNELTLKEMRLKNTIEQMEPWRFWIFPWRM